MRTQHEIQEWLDHFKALATAVTPGSTSHTVYEASWSMLQWVLDGKSEPETAWAVGDPDPTPDGGCDTKNSEGYVCTWPVGHKGQHVAGDSQYICAVWN